ncbi:hypothetical protein CRENBAI_024526 [Crenichthys baileyi]|uniref:Uncharacterized protein n=1 Tax=Crenichthys baileyi TaxID=28760 RepID=A0AAV9RPJ9_9TELE
MGAQVTDSSLQLPSLDKFQAGSFLALRSAGHNFKRNLLTLQRAPGQAPPPSAHATFFTPRTKLNWTSRKPPSSIHRLTYLEYYPFQFSLVSCSQTPHLSFPLTVQSSPPLVIYRSWFSRNYSFL